LIRIFIKDEPIKIEKAQKGRWRLIWSISLVDRIIHQIVWGNRLEAEEKAAFTHPIHLRGIANGMADRLIQNIASDRMSTSDFSAWDFTFTAEEFDLDFKMMEALCLDWGNGLFERLVRAVYASVKLKKVIFTDGVVWQQETPGIMPSGLLITYSGNSKINSLLRVRTVLRKHGSYDHKKYAHACAGDDNTGRLGDLTEDELREVAVDAGKLFKEVRISPMEEATFCSMRYLNIDGTWVAVPADPTKNVLCRRWNSRKDKLALADSLSSLMIYFAFADVAVERGIWKEKIDWWNVFRANLIKLAPEKVRSRDYHKRLHTAYD